MKRVLNKIYSAVLFLYRKMIVDRKQEANFWILYSFLVAFLTSRFVVYFFPEFSISLNGVHVHHFAYGIILLAISGLLALNGLHEKRLRLVSVIYGLGLGYAADEFGMWIHLQDDYWVRQSYDAVIVVTGVLTSTLYFSGFWRNVFARIISILTQER